MISTGVQGLRGLRDISTVRTVVLSREKLDRSLLFGRFGRLDSERARLERELVMWSTRIRTTEAKLAAVIEQMEAIRPLLVGEIGPVKTRPRGLGNVPTSSEIFGSSILRHLTVPLNY